jgi:hypothetical protein
VSRPRAHRSKITAGFRNVKPLGTDKAREVLEQGAALRADERRAVWAVLVDNYAGEPPADMLGAIERAWSTYRADTAALSNQASAGGEARDMQAIASECRQLAARIHPAVAHITAGTQPAHGADVWPRALACNLHDRLCEFPSGSDAALFVAGVDMWPLLERLRASVLRPATWPTDPTLPADLLRLADACVPAPVLGRTTKPHDVAGARFKAALLVLVERDPPEFATRMDCRDIAAQIVAALMP